MFNIFKVKVKTKLQIQVDEYLAWKQARGINIDTWGTISKFLEFNIKIDSIEDIQPQDIQNYYHHLNIIENSKYFIREGMKDVRVMFRWFKARKYNVVEPDIIGEEGLKIDPENDIIDCMTETPVKLGRPPKIDLIKKVKSLRDINKLSFREIARVVRKDVSQVYVWYYYDLQQTTK